MSKNLVYIPLQVAKLLADKEINDLQEQNMELECKVISLEEELDYLKVEPIDPYDAYMEWSDF